MKFRTKLFYSFALLGLVTTLFALCIIYVETSRLVSEEIHNKVMSILSYAQKKVDLIRLEAVIENPEKRDSVPFKTIYQDLLDIVLSNRRSDLYVEALYVLKKCEGSDLYSLLIDVGCEDKQQTPFSFLFPIEMSLHHELFLNGCKNRANDLKEYVPIFDANGAERALLGISVRKKEVALELHRLLFYGWTAFGISLFVAIIFAYFLAKHLSKSLRRFCAIVQKIGKGDFSVEATCDKRDEFQALFISIQAMAKGLEERERLKSNFARYVSKHALEEILKKDNPFSLAHQGKRKKVTLLFSDIRHFTTLAEELPPEEVLKILNEYFTEMISVIFKYQGTLDKFIGDGMMVEFGAPFKDPLQEFHAVLAAVHMQLRLKDLSDRWEKEGRQRLSMGIGIHVGFAVLGNIGSELRMEYTAIGDTVNVASRLERLTRKIERPIILSQSVYEKVKPYFICEDLKEIQIPGRKGTIQVYSIDPYVQENLEGLDLIHHKHRTVEQEK